MPGSVEGVADPRPARSGAVLELPLPARHVAIGIERARRGEDQLLTGGADLIRPGIRYRRRIDQHPQSCRSALLRTVPESSVTVSLTGYSPTLR